METLRTFEGPDLAVLLAQVHAELGPDAEVVSAERTRHGGVAGFFAKQRFTVLARSGARRGAMVGAGAPTRGAAAGREERAPDPFEEPGGLLAALLAMADEVSETETPSARSRLDALLGADDRVAAELDDRDLRSLGLGTRAGSAEAGSPRPGVAPSQRPMALGAGASSAPALPMNDADLRDGLPTAPTTGVPQLSSLPSAASSDKAPPPYHSIFERALEVAAAMGPELSMPARIDLTDDDERIDLTDGASARRRRGRKGEPDAGGRDHGARAAEFPELPEYPEPADYRGFRDAPDHAGGSGSAGGSGGSGSAGSFGSFGSSGSFGSVIDRSGSTEPWAPSSPSEPAVARDHSGPQRPIVRTPGMVGVPKGLHPRSKVSARMTTGQEAGRAKSSSLPVSQAQALALSQPSSLGRPVPAGPNPNLLRLGLPAHLAHDADPSVRSLSAILERLPRAEAGVATARGVVAVLGRMPMSRQLACHLSADAAVASREMPQGLAAWLWIPDAAEAAQRRSRWSYRERPVLVAVEGSPASSLTSFSMDILRAIQPGSIRIIVEAAWSLDAMHHWVDQLSALKVPMTIDVVGVEAAAEPAAVLQLGLPVATLDGLAATPEWWASVLVERLGDPEFHVSH